MSKEEGKRGKKNAFAVLLQASPHARSIAKHDGSKKRRLTESGESSLSICPVCGGTFPAVFVQQHVETCLEKPNSKDRQAPKPAVQQESKPAASEKKPASESSGRPAESVHDASRDAQGGTDANAFSRLMQRQRSHSNVHNFYLEKLPGESFRWHWFLTCGASETRFQAQLNPAQKEPEFSQGAVDPQDSEPGLQGHKDSRSLQTDPDTGQSPASGRPEVQPTSLSEQRHVVASAPETRNSPSADTSGDADDKPAEDSTKWERLPPVRWHAMSQMLASKIGGPPKLKISVRLLTNLRPGDGGNVNWDSPELASNRGRGVQYQGSISVLKSAMQKNVRLCRPKSAVRCGLHIMKEDCTEFLRRCAIICLEDSILHPALPILVWCMAAHAKGYILGRSVLTRCLAVLFHVAHSPIKDTLHLEGSRKYRSSLDLFEHAKGLSGDQQVLVRVILLRAAFGGMQGDVQLLQGFAQMWSDRFSGFVALESGQNPSEASQAWHKFLWANVTASHESLEDKDRAYSIEAIKAITMDDIPPSAVDFHVSSIIEDLLNESDLLAKAKELKKDAAHLMRQSMWKFRSGISNKEIRFSPDMSGELDCTEADLRAFWQIASPHVEAWTADFLSKRFR